MDGFNAVSHCKNIMQLPDEKPPTTPVANGAQIYSFPEFERSLFADNPFLGRAHNPPTFFQMLASLSTSPARHFDRQVDTSPSASLSVESTMDGRNTLVPSSAVRVESTTDGCDTLVPPSAAGLSAPVPAEGATGAPDPPVITRRRGLRRRKCHLSQ